MATVKHTITDVDGWVEVAADATDFLLDVINTTPVKITLQATAPAVDAPYHLLAPGEALVRVGTGAAYVATANGSDAEVIVTT